MKYEWILTLIMGAFIGYCTNWLAIKMLFRPYNEKKIFGVKIPFTPGVIPKERGRMAVKIGEVIEEYLLTDDLIVEELVSEDIQKKVVTYMESHVFNESGDISLESLGEVLTANEAVKTVVIDTMTQAFIDGAQGDFVKTKLTDLMNGLLDEDKSLEQIIPDSIQGLLNQSLQFNTLNIVNEIKAVIRKEAVESYITRMIDQVVEEKMGGLGAMFVKAPEIYQTIILKADEQLEDPLIQEQLMSFVSQKLEALYKQQLYQVMPVQMKSSFIEKMSDELEKVVGTESSESIIREAVTGVLEHMKQMVIHISPRAKEEIGEIFKAWYKGFITNSVRSFLSQISLGKIIEKEINGFDTEMIEEIIFDIAKHELNAITRLGALLGFVLAGIILIF